MKKYFVILIMVLALGLLLAVESAPSATVGYFKKASPSGSWTTMSLPFGYANLSPDAIFGTQFAQDDQIQDVYTGTGTTFFDGFGWFGDLAELSYGVAYWVSRAAANPDLDYYIMGTVDPQPLTLHVNANSWTSFALNESIPIDVTTLVIPAIQDDQIQDVFTGTGTTYFDGFGWFGDLATLDPTQGYWYSTTNPVAFDWYYTPAARGAAAPAMVKPTLQRSAQPSGKMLQK